MTLEDWLCERSIALHRAARKAWKRSERERLHRASREFAARATEAKQMREMLKAHSPSALAIIELDHLERTDSNALYP